MTLILLAASGFAAETPEERLQEFTQGMQTQFDGVETVSVDELADMVPRPVLLDVRAPKEFAVSRIPGSIRADKDAVSQLQRLGVAPDDPVIVYCSIGYRSSLLAEKLQKVGFSNVRNLEGSIFAWAHAGGDLVNAHGEAEGVHPYNRWWGRYLRRTLWQWEATGG